MSDKVGIKYCNLKNKMHLFPMECFEAINWALTYGAYLYAGDNWKLVSEELYKDALLRHHVKIEVGDIFDEESGLPHTYHRAACDIFLLWKDMQRNHFIVDPAKLYENAMIVKAKKEKK